MDFRLVPRGEDRNYTGFLTKTIVYTGSLILFLASFGLTISSIAVPRWVSYDSPTFHYSYGLHRRCSSVEGACWGFPQREDCHGEDRYFCSMWRSVGFLMSFAVVLEGMSLVAFLIVLSGGKRLRESGWKVLSLFILLSAVVQAASMGIVVSSFSLVLAQSADRTVSHRQAYLFDNEKRFFPGWVLSDSWIFCTVSWCVSLFCAAALILAAYMLPSEGGYELIPDNEG
ncbi:hypothetical protein BO82DRAFT_276390 [Aspergillus uvarum CBS 121591]|uniref:Uncharacterized protein n=1 Tax=Aspergillus uvarum CBS 121591 TaxID=1448315 RepID=A0A319CLH2_9EURO|nr:hypothetical protein BO82DRAFT_276390 [Aspergillus uvarum CBS 121591]PYH84771.1 hypothetical protein BO82DRAFT_276390 [Aspergillus uvarum CBS 121591]